MSEMDDQAINDSNFWHPLYLSSIAGGSTCIGAAIVFLLNNRVSPELMSFSLALAGSVMVTVSVISIGPECINGVTSAWVFAQRLGSFLIGCGLYFLLYKYALPDPEAILGLDDGKDIVLGTNASQKCLNDESNIEMSADAESALEETEDLLGNSAPEVFFRKQEFNLNSQDISSYWNGKDLETQEKRRAWRVAVLLFFSLLVHNFPEGLAVAASAIQSPSLGVTMTVGIMIHNIPEGIAIAVPCHAARPHQPWFSFALASISGLAEPLGAFFSLFFIRGLGHDTNSILNLENVLAFVAGIMITVALHELFPEARMYQKGWPFWSGSLLGFIIMLCTENVLDG